MSMQDDNARSQGGSVKPLPNPDEILDQVQKCGSMDEAYRVIYSFLSNPIKARAELMATSSKASNPLMNESINNVDYGQDQQDLSTLDGRRWHDNSEMQLN